MTRSTRCGVPDKPACGEEMMATAVMVNESDSAAAAPAKTAAHAAPFTVSIELQGGYEQAVDFGIPDSMPFAVDEPAPLGDGAGPNPARLLAASVGSCLAASLLFCMRKARIEVTGLRTTVEGSIVRNNAGRLRIGAMRVRLEPELPADQHERVPRCIELFEDFCMVTASVRQGIPIDVVVEPADHVALTGHSIS